MTRPRPVRTPAALLAGLALLLPCAACSTRHDPHYNPYGPNNGAPTLTEHLEGAIGGVERALEDLDLRLEQAVY